MKVRVPYYFNQFNCIADKCESTCCANWEVVIDDDSFEKYKNVTGSFKDTLRNNLTKNSDDEKIFLLKKDRCSFLNKNNTCDLYINLGKDSLCYTCSKYPRFIETFLDLKEMGLSLSCPEAARIIIKENAPINFHLSTDDEIFEDVASPFDKNILNQFLIARDLIFKILDSSSLSFKEKITIILSFVNDIQIKIDLGDTEEIPDVITEYKDFSKDHFLNKVLEYISEEEVEILFNEDDYYKEILIYFNHFKDFKQLNDNDSLGILDSISFIENNPKLYLEKRNDFSSYFKENNYIFKNILVYFIFRYFLKGFFDFDLSSKIKISIISLIIIRELAIIHWLNHGTLTNADFVKILYNFSKNIEHLEENISSMEDIFETKDEFKLCNILNLIDFSI